MGSILSKKRCRNKHDNNDDDDEGSTAASTFLCISRTDVRKEALNKLRLLPQVGISRIIFLLGLGLVASLLGYGAYKSSTNSEIKLAKQQYTSIADRALDTALEITLRKRIAVMSLATTISYTFPNAIQWPYVNIYGFEAITKSIIQTSSSILDDENSKVTMGFAPLVTSENLNEFNDYMYNVAFPNNNYPNGTGINDETGYGVYGFDENFQRYYETDGTTFWGSPYNNTIWPISMHSSGPDILMMNLHSLEIFGPVIDEMHTCANNRDNNVTTLDLSECSILSDIRSLYKKDGTLTDPSAYIIQPIYPANDPNVLTGLITSTMLWGDVLGNLFPSEVNGVDCVLETDTKAFTYHVVGGVSTLIGEGDLHNRDYTEYGQSVHVSGPESFSHSSAMYTLTIYPNEDFFHIYSTNNPIMSVIVAVCSVVFTSILFFLYDYFVRQEFNHKQALLQAKREYMRYISHEVRTPLNTIVMGAQMIQDDMNNTASNSNDNNDSNNTNDNNNKMTTKSTNIRDKISDWKALVMDILTSAKSAVGVLSDLLNYDKIDSGTMNLELSVIPIWALIQRTVDEFKLPAASKRINLELDFNSLLFDSNNSDVNLEAGIRRFPQKIIEQRVIGDTVRITQILRNFLSNAIKFTPEDGNIVVSVSQESPTETKTVPKDKFVLNNGQEILVSKSGFVQVKVTDSGAGMSKEQVETVFGEGVQFNVNELQAGQGSGLGLFIANGIAELHGGSLKVASKGLGQGTTFTVTLPLHRIRDDELPEGQLAQLRRLEGEDACIQPDKPPLETFRILVVDDARVNRKLLLRMLRKRGYICDEAEDGLEAKEMVEKAQDAGDPYTVILLDYEMPIMNGPTAAKKMREIGCSSFIAGVTGNILPEDVNYFRMQGADVVLPKPVDLRTMEEIFVEHGVGSITEPSCSPEASDFSSTQAPSAASSYSKDGYGNRLSI